MSTPGGELEARLVRQLRGDVDVPVEDVGAPRGGADPEVQLERRRRSGRAARAAPCARAPTPTSPSSSKRSALRAGDDAQLEGAARRPGADDHRLVVDRHQALAAAHLLGGDVGEQLAAHRALVVGGEALALARDQRPGRSRARRAARGSARARRPAPPPSLTISCTQAMDSSWARMRSRQPATAAASSASSSSPSEATCARASETIDLVGARRRRSGRTGRARRRAPRRAAGRPARLGPVPRRPQPAASWESAG